MSRIITMPEMGIILDGIYRNYSKAKIDQKSVNKLAVDCHTSVPVLLKVRSILSAMRLLIIEGERRSQKCYWSPVKSAPNPTMLTEIYRIYTKDIKSRVKVENRKRRVPSKELALQAFAKDGAAKVIVVYRNGRETITKEYDLSISEVGE